MSYREGVKETPSNRNNARVATIKWCTKGIFFAGTPHHGSEKAKWASVATSLALFVHKDKSTRLVDALKQGSDTLDMLQDHFKDILESFAIYTLIEEKPFPKIGKIVEKDSARIGWHEVEILIHADHRDMVRFADAADNNYQRIRQTFEEILRDRIEGAAYAKTGLPNCNRASFLAALHASRPRSGIATPGLTLPARLTLEHQSSRDFSFGRVNTLAPEESVEWLTGRGSAEHLQSRESLGSFTDPVNRGSTTTLGTMGSTGSRGSNMRPRMSAEGRLSSGNSIQFSESIEDNIT